MELNGGDDRIRTFGGLFNHTTFPMLYHKPLGHVTKRLKQKKSIFSPLDFLPAAVLCLEPREAVGSLHGIHFPAAQLRGGNPLPRLGYLDSNQEPTS